MRGHRTIAILAIAWASLAGPIVAQQDAELPEATERMLEDVSGIHQSLERLVGLLETLREHQKVELLIKRIELKERRLAPMESRLRSAENTVKGIEDELTRLRTMREQIEEALNDNEIRGEATPEDGSREMLVHIERELEVLGVQVEAERLRARELEDDLAEGREDVEDLDEMLIELLE